MLIRSIGIGISLSFLVIGSAFAQAAPNPEISDEEFAELIALLDEAQDAVISKISGMTDEQWNFKQNPDRWSVGECVEHVTIAQFASLETVKGIIASEPDPEWYAKTNGKTAFLREAVPNRPAQGVGGVTAPDELRPTNQWGRAEAIRQFFAAQAKTRAYLETMNRSVKDRTRASSIAALGWMNAYDWMNLIPLHTLRHSRQIAEVQADANYPKKPAPQSGEGPNPSATEAELAYLYQQIDEGYDILLGLISGMTDEQWFFKENPDRWSTSECVEHIAMGERAVLDGIANMARGPRNVNWHSETEGKLALVRETVLSRPKGGAGSPFVAPGEVGPVQNWDRARGIETFIRTHGELRAFAETLPPDIKSITFLNPFPQIGMLNSFDWLNLMALHVKRHSMQIAEILDDPNYPK